MKTHKMQASKKTNDIRLPRHCGCSGKKKEIIKTVIIVVSVCIGSFCYRDAFFSPLRALFISFYAVFFSVISWPILVSLQIVSPVFFTLLFARIKLMIFFYDFSAHLKEYDVIIVRKRKRKNKPFTHLQRHSLAHSISFRSLIIPKRNDVISYILFSLSRPKTHQKKGTIRKQPKLFLLFFFTGEKKIDEHWKKNSNFKCFKEF